VKRGSADKVAVDLEKLLFINTLDIFDSFLPKLKEVYLESYTDLLLVDNIEEGSLANPLLFYEEYEEALNNFTYVSVAAKGEVKMLVPDEDNFEFEGRLKFLHWLSIGVINSYYELPINDYNYLINYEKLSKQIKNSLLDLPGFFGEITNDLDFYLVDESLNIHGILQNILNKKLIRFPFSNTQAIELFEDGKGFFNKSKEALTNKIVDKSLEDIKRRAY